MNFSELVFGRLNRSLEVRDYIHWAERLLVEGCGSTAVAELASYSWDRNPDLQEVKRAFQSCVRELGLWVPTEEEWYQALKDFTCSICREMLNGTREPEDGLSELLNISEDHHDPFVLTIWLDLARDLHEWAFGGEGKHIPFNTPLLPKNHESCILETAEQYIALCTLTLPEKFPRIWWCLVCGHTSNTETATAQQTSSCPNCQRVATFVNARHYEQRERIANAGSFKKHFLSD